MNFLGLNHKMGCKAEEESCLFEFGYCGALECEGVPGRKCERYDWKFDLKPKVDFSRIYKPNQIEQLFEC